MSGIVETHVIAERDPPQKSKFWELLNSNFVLFLLSSIVLGGLTFGYQQLDGRRKTWEEHVSRLQHLETEIRYRLETIRSMAQPSFSYTVLYNTHGAMLGVIGNKTWEDHLVGEYAPIYIELENRNFVSLLWELQELRRKDDKTYSLSAAIHASHELVRSWNENSAMVRDVVHGHSDSIWHFKRSEQLDEFARNLDMIQAALPTSSTI